MFHTKVVYIIKIHILYSINLFFGNRGIYEIMWKKYVRSGYATNDKIIRRMHIPCWITKAINTHSEYETHITCPWQHWLRQRVSILCLCAHCLPSSNMTLIQPLRALYLWNWTKIRHFGVRIICFVTKKKALKILSPFRTSSHGNTLRTIKHIHNISLQFICTASSSLVPWHSVLWL